MFPFWEVAVAPVLEAAEARLLVEVGALRGENTRKIIERLGPDTELHVIDPLPDFDPAIHEEEFAGQYVFHRDLSLNVLGDLPPMDAALIDGDHNWYTVYNELRLLREVARANDAPLPVLLLHDVGWPYGRRDLYYDPTNIPAEHLRDWKRAGMEPGKSRLVPFGAGLNPTLANAKVQGGVRNGVMTGLDDFVKEHDRPMRVVVLPIYFGLAIAVEQERLDRQPALAAELDRLESPAGKDQLLELAEDIRLESLIFQHKIFYDRERSIGRLAVRYLGQVKDGSDVGPDGRATLDAIEAALDDVRTEHVLGDAVAVGVDRPGPAVFLRAYLEAYDLLHRRLWVHGDEAGVAGLRAGLDRLDLDDDRTLDGSGTDRPSRVALVLVGAGAGAVATSVLDDLHERLAHGAHVLVDPAGGPEALAVATDLLVRHGVAEAEASAALADAGWRNLAGSPEVGRAAFEDQVDVAEGI